MTFSYRLIVLTHGDNEEMLGRALDSFRFNVEPEPADGYLLCDGCGVPEVDWPWRTGVIDDDGPVGFCSAVAAAWKIAAEPGADWVFWLEHDFIFKRPVNLEHLAYVLSEHELLAQMALPRQAVNAAELEAGGLVASRPGQFRHFTTFREEATYDWLEHASYWTTNPSLFPVRTALEYEWPTEPECEGHFGIGLAGDGHRFGLWGKPGEEWVEHVGVRTGFGY